MIKEGRKVSEIRDELGLRPSDLRARVMVLKRMGLPIFRKGTQYILKESVKKDVIIKSHFDLLTAAVQATKVLRFIYGEEVRFLWPSKVTLDKEVIATLEGPVLTVNGPDEWLTGAITLRTYDAMRRRRLSEVLRTANLLLYKDPVKILTDNGTLKERILGVDIEGHARTSKGKLSPDEVRDVWP